MQDLLTAHKTAVLIVEDESLVALDIQETLNQLGYDAFGVAASADEALEIAAERCPQVVLMDIRIQGELDGIQAAALLRERFGVPVVYLTAHADTATVERAKRTYPHGYLLKPVKSAELRSAIEVAIHRSEAEKRARQEKRWLSTTLQSLTDAVIVSDVHGFITMVNTAAEALLGISSDQLVGRPADEEVDLRVHGMRISPFSDVLRRGAGIEVPQATLKSPTRGERIISDSVSPVRDGDTVLGVVMVIRDITEERQLLGQLAMTARVASLGAVAAIFAHEINNPLSVILANAPYVEARLRSLSDELSRGGAVSRTSAGKLAEALEALEEIQASTRRAAKVVADLREKTRSNEEQAGRANLMTCVRTAIHATKGEFARDAEVAVEFDENTLPGPLAIDPSRLEQILVNLLTNAAHAMREATSAEQRVRVTAAPAKCNLAAIDVTDTGPGIPTDLIDRVVDPFFTTKKDGQGTGLGLAICHGIAVANGGRLEIESQLGRGTTIHLLLPLASHMSQPPPDMPTTRAVGRLLVIDDDPAVLTATARSLEGHEVTCMESARQALAALHKGDHYDLIFCDLKMPEMDGVQFHDHIVAEFPEMVERLVFLTGGSTLREESVFLAESQRPRLEKPFEPDALNRLVQELLVS